MKKYVISWHDSVNHGGSKAKQDVENFLMQDGYQIIDTPSGKINKILYTYFGFPQKIKEIKDSIIVFQFPSGKPFLRKKMMDCIRNSSNKLIILIHDIECLRLNHVKNRQRENAEEISQLKNCDGIISHNEKMTEWLRAQEIKVPISNLKIFDYDNPHSINKLQKYDRSVCFAGNLEKSSFLKKLRSNHKVVLYGSHPAEKYHSNIQYLGMLPADELPKKLTQNFGLVWDGPDLEACTGPYGEYMKYNDPHKVSLYLSSGVPIIIWDQAALASFIKKNKLGITINNLNELDSILESLSVEDYRELKNNVDNISKSLRQGMYVKSAMKDMLQKLTKENENG